MKKSTTRFLAVATAAGLVAALTACSSSSTGSGTDAAKVDDKAKVTISVGDEPTADQAADRANFLKKVATFEKANPNITVNPSTEKWEAQSFQAKLAGGTLPTVMGVSLTYSRSLIENGQLPNMTPYLKKIGLLKQLNPLALKNVQDDKGRVYTVPTGLFSVGLAYNRTIFTEAGLDPDKPPTTWAEVRAAAKTITEKVPGVAGYSQLTTNNTGGWMLTTMTYSMGGKVVTTSGKKTDIGPASTEALQLLHDMRWKDGSMGSQFLYDQDQIRQTFSAGKIGMMLQAPDIYGQATHTYGMDPKDFGEAALPQAHGINGTLTGGSIQMFNAKATPEQLLAAAKWVKYTQFEQYFNKDLALQNAKAAQGTVNPPGLPGIPPVSNELNDRYLGWIKPYIDVPLDQFAGYTSSNLKLIPEPAIESQQVYASLDPVVQKILTNKSAGIKSTLRTAASTIDKQLAQASR